MAETSEIVRHDCLKMLRIIFSLFLINVALFTSIAAMPTQRPTLKRHRFVRLVPVKINAVCKVSVVDEMGDSYYHSKSPDDCAPLIAQSGSELCDGTFMFSWKWGGDCACCHRSGNGEYVDGRYWDIYRSHTVTSFPTRKPTTTKQPTRKPTTKQLTREPATKQPTRSPTTTQSTKYPTKYPTREPTTRQPTKYPTKYPTTPPASYPVNLPTSNPSQETAEFDRILLLCAATFSCIFVLIAVLGLLRIKQRDRAESREHMAKESVVLAGSRI